MGQTHVKSKAIMADGKKLLVYMGSLTVDSFFHDVAEANTLARHFIDSTGQHLVFRVTTDTKHLMNYGIFFRVFAQVEVSKGRYRPEDTTLANWSCDRCTLINDERVNVCSACLKPREFCENMSPGSWSCSHCTLVNVDNITECNACGLYRDKSLESSRETERPDILGCSSGTPDLSNSFFEAESTKTLNLHHFCSLLFRLRNLHSAHSARISMSSDNTDPETMISASAILGTIASESETEEVDLCPICLERSFNCILPCAHGYCEPCLSQWRRRGGSCPLCRCKGTRNDDAWVMADAPSDFEVSQHVIDVFDHLPSDTNKGVSSDDQ